jgi:DNA-binding PadR family transcriptional regulator
MFNELMDLGMGPQWAGWRGGHHGRFRGHGHRRGGGGPGWLGDFFEPPPRADRGGVRYLVLDAIAAQARHGYEVIQAIEERSQGAYRPSPGVVYPTLQLLEELQHARADERDGRKVYAITDAGAKDLEAHRDEVDEFYERLADNDWERRAEDIADLFKRTARLLRTFKRAARRGRLSNKAKARICEVLDDATTRIEAIVDEDGAQKNR